MIIEQLSLFGEPVVIEHGHLPQTDLNTLYSFAKEQALLQRLLIYKNRTIVPFFEKCEKLLTYQMV